MATTNFERQRVIDNISALLLQFGKKVGDLETALGVSTGYYSKLARKDNDSTLSAEFVWKAANFFSVTTDTLISADMNKAGDTIIYLRNIFAKLERETEEGCRTWNEMSIDVINYMLTGEMEPNYPVVEFEGEPYPEWQPEESNNPFFLDYAMACHGNRKILSTVEPGAVVTQNGSFFYTALDDQHLLYVMPLVMETPGDPVDFFEVVIVSIPERRRFIHAEAEQGEHFLGRNDIPAYVEDICTTFANSSKFTGLALLDDIKKLYRTIRMHAHDVRISPKVRSILDAYLGTGEDTANQRVAVPESSHTTDSTPEADTH